MGDYTVYKHTSPTGKVYIGITRQLPEVRWKRGAGYKNNSYFYNAIKRYGWDSFRHELLYTGLTESEACNIEERLIAEFKSAYRAYGYNIALGGNTTSPSDETKKKTSKSVKAVWDNPEYRNIVSDKMRGVKRSDESRKRISEAQKKRFEKESERSKVSERQKGSKRTEEAKRKTSESLKKYYSDQENIKELRKKRLETNRNIHARKIMCIDTGVLYEAAVDAEKETGIAHQNIIKVCQGNRKTAGGFRWAYLQNR